MLNHISVVAGAALIHCILISQVLISTEYSTFSQHRLHLCLPLQHVHQDTCRGSCCWLTRVLSTVCHLYVLNLQVRHVVASLISAQILDSAGLSSIKLENLNNKL